MGKINKFIGYFLLGLTPFVLGALAIWYVWLAINWLLSYLGLFQGERVFATTMITLFGIPLTGVICFWLCSLGQWLFDGDEDYAAKLSAGYSATPGLKRTISTKLEERKERRTKRTKQDGHVSLTSDKRGQVSIS